VVMAVVTRAMRTIIVKTAGVRTPSLRPAVRMTSSMRPRVFMSMPTALASRQGSLAARAARVAPPNLPAVATTMISAV
jgi:hypothetical protein